MAWCVNFYRFHHLKYNSHKMMLIFMFQLLNFFISKYEIYYKRSFGTFFFKGELYIDPVTAGSLVHGSGLVSSS